jgi:hypothetical protein
MKGFDDFSIIHQHHEFHSNAINQRLHSINTGNVQHNTQPQNSTSFSQSLSSDNYMKSFDNTGVMNYSGSVTPHNVNELSHLINVRSTMKNGWGPNVFSKLTILNLSHSGLTGMNLEPLFKSIHYQKMDLNLLDLSYNKLCNDGLGHLLSSVGNASNKQPHHIVNFKLNNNLLGDKAAEYFCWNLSGGTLPKTKYIDVSGNKITKDGETKLVQALKGKVQDMVIITQKLEQNSKLFIGTKDEKIAIYKEFIKQGIEKGTYDKGIVVDKSLWGEIKNIKNSVKGAFYGGVGFVKCNWKPEEMVKSYAQDKITAKISKAFSKILGQFTDIEGIVSCYLEATDEAWTSSPGMEVIRHDLCVLGEQEFCGD